MLIIAGQLTVQDGGRATYLESQRAFIGSTRAKPGCLGFYMVADPVDADVVNLFERWESEEHLAAHQASADPPEPGVEIVADDVQKFQIAVAGPVFG